MSDQFLGFPRDDGQVGARNFLLMLSGTLYANTLCERVADMLVDTIPIVHPLGRCQVKPDLALTFKTLVGHGCNPNAGGVVVIDHFKEEGCTADDIAHEIAQTGKPVEVVNIRREGGLVSALEKAMRAGMCILRQISDQRREAVPVSKLLFGVNCGTSDATSGLSSNPATGHCSDLIINQGGRTLMAETMEMLGAEDVMAARCRNEQVAAKLIAAIEGMEQRALDAGADIRGSQPTGDNIVGGLSSIEEKSLGGIQKSGTAEIVDVVEYAERVGDEPGLYIMNTPGHGGESITGIAAAGSQVMVFSTGGGHTINHPLMITIRATGNAVSYEKMEDTTEVCVADVFEGTSIAEAGERIYQEVLATASGRMTKAEICKEYNAFAIHRIGPSI